MPDIKVIILLMIHSFENLIFNNYYFFRQIDKQRQQFKIYFLVCVILYILKDIHLKKQISVNF